MVPASDRLYQAVVQQRLTLPDNEELRQHMANTIARHNRRGWQLDKPGLEQPNDSVIALCMAVEALENQPEPVEGSDGYDPLPSPADNAPKAHAANAARDNATTPATRRQHNRLASR